MVIDLEIATVMGMRTDRCMDTDIDVAMFTRLKIVPKFSWIGQKI